MATLYAGTSGFAYPAWKPGFYPAKTPAGQFLKVYAARLNYNAREMGPALDLFRGTRACTAQLFDFMSDEDWRREGTHSESGAYSAEDWLKIYAAHAHNHAAQIQRLKEALGGSAAASA